MKLVSGLLPKACLEQTLQVRQFIRRQVRGTRTQPTWGGVDRGLTLPNMKIFKTVGQQFSKDLANGRLHGRAVAITDCSMWSCPKHEPAAVLMLWVPGGRRFEFWEPPYVNVKTKVRTECTNQRHASICASMHAWGCMYVTMFYAHMPTRMHD